MATTIKIKNKVIDTSSSGPARLRQGELAYASVTNPATATYNDAKNKLFIGAGTEEAPDNDTNNLHIIGGKYFTDMMDHEPGKLQVDGNVVKTIPSIPVLNPYGEIDEFRVGNFYLNDNVLKMENASAAGVGLSGQTDINLVFDLLGDGYIKLIAPVSGTYQDDYAELIRVVNDNNAIPNKQYVDEEVASIVSGSTTLNINGFNAAADVATPTYAGQGSVSLGSENLNIVAGTGLSLTIVDTEFGNIDPAPVTLTIDADVASDTVLGVASFDTTNFTVTAGDVVANNITLGSTVLSLGAAAVTSITGLVDITSGNIKISGDLIESVNTGADGDISITPKGVGVVKIGTLNISKVNTIATTTVNGNISITPNWDGIDPAVVGAVSVANSQGGESRITKVADPILESDAANRRYVDSVAQGLTIRPAARAATTTNLDASYAAGGNLLRPGVGATLTANSLLALPVIDGVADGAGIPAAIPPQTDRPWAVGDLILVRQQLNKPHNGLYEVTTVGVDGVTAWVLTRHEYVDDNFEIPSSYVFVQEGASLSGTGWSALVEDFNTFDVGVDDIFWYQFSGAGSVTAGDGILVSGTTVAVRLDPTVNSGLEFDAQGDLVIGTVPVTNGGTGRTAVPKNAIVFGTNKIPVFPDVEVNDGLGALAATESPGSVTANTGDWNSSNQLPTYDSAQGIIRWTTTIYGGTW